MTKLCFITLFLALLHVTSGFTANHQSIIGRRPFSTKPLQAGREEDSGGGAAIAKPKIKVDIKTETVTKQKSQTKKKAKTGGPVSRKEEDFEDAPMFKLMLLGDDSYDGGHVIERMCAIVEDMDEDQAAKVFQQANQEGKAMCGKYPFERAELFKEQLIRSDPMIFSDLEEDK